MTEGRAEALQPGFDGVGIFEGVPFAAYHQWAGISHRHIWKLNEKTPEHYKHALEHEDEVDSPAIRLGLYVHALVLEGEDSDAAKAFVQQPATYTGAKDEEKPWSNNAKFCQAWNAEQAAVGRTVLTEALWAEGCEMTRRIRLQPTFVGLLDGAATEVCLQWNDPDTGLLLRGRPDLWNPGKAVLADLKCSCAAQPQVFGTHAYKQGWLSKAALYLMGLETILGRELHKPPVFVVAESSDPYAVAVHQWDNPVEISLAKQQITPLLRQIAECQRENEWPGYADGPYSILTPTWAFTEVGAEQ